MKIISGGQRGAELGALDAAKDSGIDTGGWMPRGWLTKGGPRPEYRALYRLQESGSGSYGEKIRLNVRDADATLACAPRYNWSEKDLVKSSCQKLRKPMLLADIHAENETYRKLQIPQVVAWIKKENIQVLHVTGSSCRSSHSLVREFIFDVLSALADDERRIVSGVKFRRDWQYDTDRGEKDTTSCLTNGSISGCSVS